MSYKKQELLTLHEHLSSPLFFGGVRVAHLLSMFVYLRSVFRAVMSVTISTYIQCSVRFYLQLFAGGPMSYLRYL